ncbi:DUF2226 domain-containing protein [Methanococcus sp. CF]
MEIIEGKFVKMGSNYKELFDELPNNFLGHIRLSLKLNGRFKESHLFLKDKKIIGGYSDYEGEFFGNSAVSNAMKMAELGAIVDVFEYTDSMLSVMENSNEKLFFTNETVKKSVVEKKKAIISNNSRISIPEGKPLKLGISGDFEKYLGKYALLEVFKKVNGNYLRCYVAYEGQLPVAAAYQAENKLTFGNSAFEMFKNMIDEGDGIAIDIYEYNKSKQDYFIEEYPNSVLSNKSAKPAQIEKKEPETPKYASKIEKIYEIIEEDYEDEDEDEYYKEENPVKVEEDISREELMKKLGIRTPTEDMIENLLENVFEPSKTEISAIENELLEKINDYLSTTNVLEYNTELSMDCNDEGEFIAKCLINTTSDGGYGVNFAVDPKIIKKDVENIFDSYVIDIISDITVNNKKLEQKNSNNRYEIDLKEELNKIKVKHSDEKKTNLDKIKENVKNGINEYLENVTDISEFEVHLSIVEDDGYSCKCSIVVVPKKMLGFIKGNLNTDKLKKDISDMLTLNDIKIEFLNINVEKFTTSYSKYK